jgi:hypothetical protein
VRAGPATRRGDAPGGRRGGDGRRVVVSRGGERDTFEGMHDGWPSTWRAGSLKKAQRNTGAVRCSMPAPPPTAFKHRQTHASPGTHERAGSDKLHLRCSNALSRVREVSQAAFHAVECSPESGRSSKDSRSEAIGSLPRAYIQQLHEAAVGQYKLLVTSR